MSKQPTDVIGTGEFAGSVSLSDDRNDQDLLLYVEGLGHGEIRGLTDALRAEIASTLPAWGATPGTDWARGLSEQETELSKRINIALSGVDKQNGVESFVRGSLARLLLERADLRPDARVCVTTTPGRLIGLAKARDLIADAVGQHDPELPLWIVIVGPAPDLLVMEIFPWATRLAPTNRARVALVNAVAWEKEIVGWTICPPHDHQKIRRFKGIEGWMTLASADNLNALVFRKPGFLGIWRDVFYFDMGEFLDVLGGRLVTFHWFQD